MEPDLSLIGSFLGLLETRNFSFFFNYLYPTTLRIPTVETSDAGKGVEPPAPRENGVFVGHHQGE